VNVESTESSAPAPCAIAAISGMSQTRVVGLAITSVCTSFVFGRTAARTASGSLVSTNVASTP
jgi:hypothetical protein